MLPHSVWALWFGQWGSKCFVAISPAPFCLPVMKDLRDKPGGEVIHCSPPTIMYYSSGCYTLEVWLWANPFDHAHFSYSSQNKRWDYTYCPEDPGVRPGLAQHLSNEVTRNSPAQFPVTPSAAVSSILCGLYIATRAVTALSLFGNLWSSMCWFALQSVSYQKLTWIKS